jgi:hypothetical protein
MTQIIDKSRYLSLYLEKGAYEENLKHAQTVSQQKNHNHLDDSNRKRIESTFLCNLVIQRAITSRELEVSPFKQTI